MNGETAFFAVLLGGLGLAFVGIGLVISAFAGRRRKLTKAGIVRAAIGGALIIVCSVMSFVFLR